MNMYLIDLSRSIFVATSPRNSSPKLHHAANAPTDAPLPGRLGGNPPGQPLQTRVDANEGGPCGRTKIVCLPSQMRKGGGPCDKSLKTYLKTPGLPVKNRLAFHTTGDHDPPRSGRRRTGDRVAGVTAGCAGQSGGNGNAGANS